MKLNQMAADLHFLTTPLRVVVEIVTVSAFILSFPLLCLIAILLVGYGHSVAGFLHHIPYFPPVWAEMFNLPAGDVWLLSILLMVFGPFASAAWFSFLVKYYEVRARRREPLNLKRFITPFFSAGFAFLLSAVAGILVFTFRPDIWVMGYGAETLYLCLMVSACFCPSVLYLLYRAIFR